MNNILNISPLMGRDSQFSLWYLVCDLVEEHVTSSLHKTRLGELNFQDIHSNINWKACILFVSYIFSM